MAELLLMRHAKSSWDQPGLSDRDRPLNARGRGDAPRMGKWLISEGIRPDAVVTSDAARAIETWEWMAAMMPETRAEVRPEIYHAGTDALLAVIRDAAPKTKRLLVIGHEPGLSYVTEMLARDPVPVDCQRAFEKFPTAGIAVMETDAVPWHRIGKGSLRFRAFAVPKEVTDNKDATVSGGMI